MDDKFIKKEQKIILQLVISLNKGNVSYPNDRVDIAIRQLNIMKSKGLTFEE